MPYEDDEYESVNQGSATIPLTTLQAMNRDLLFVQDNFTLRRVLDNPDTNIASIRGSHLNRLTFISRKQAMIDNLESDLDYAILETFTEEEEFDSGLWFNIKSIKRNEKLGINDSVDGQKIKALVEKRRSTEYHESVGDRKKIGGIL